jgi:hypothetical protein
MPRGVPTGSLTSPTFAENTHSASSGLLPMPPMG